MTTPPTPAERTAIAGRITNWMPQNVEDPDPAVLATTRMLVTAAHPQSLSLAGQALSHTFRFVAWAAANGVDVTDVAGVVDVQALERYEGDPEGLGGVSAGSRRAARSYLRRIAVGDGGLVSQAGGKHKQRRSRTPTAPVTARRNDTEVLGLGVEAATGEREPVSTDPYLGSLELSSWPKLNPEVAEMLSRYLPAHLDRSISERVAPLARAATAATRPTNRRRVLAVARPCFYLAAWVDAAHRPLRSDVVFAEATMAEFLTVVGERLGPATAGTFRSMLAIVSRSVIPGTRKPVLPRFERTKARPPATDAEVARLFAWAKGRQSASAKRHATAMVLLAIAAGLDGSDSGWVRPEHLVELANGVGIEVHKPDDDDEHDDDADDDGRVVFERVAFVLPDYVQAVREAFAEAAAHNDKWLLGGGNIRRKRTTALRYNSGNWASGGSLAGLRNRWLVELVEGRQLSLFDVMRTAGFTTLRPLEDLLSFVSNRSTELERLEEAS